MSGNHDTIFMARGTTSRVPITQNISGVSAESGGKVFAGHVDNSNNSEYYGGTHYHQHPKRPETPPSPLSTIPFRRDPDFVDRGTLLDQIHEKGSKPGSRIALVGLGGVGKSQLAIEYCYQVRDQSPETWVFWVHASNPARFEQSFRDIADQVKIFGRQDPIVSIFQLVENWLTDGKRGRWLLILDNVDDDGFLRQHLATVQQGLRIGQPNAPSQPLLEFLPRSSNGSIIITSRSKEVALNIVDHKDLIEIEPMKREEALALLRRKLKLPEETRQFVKLVEELDFMPLAIVQATGYIKHRSLRCSVSQYLERFRKSDGEAKKLLYYEADDLYRDREAKNSILVTWQISFDHIRQTRQSAADLLSLMSFFDRQGIPENLLRVQGERSRENSSLKETVNDSSDEDADSTSEFDTDDEFEDDIAMLRDFAFISIGDNSAVFTMHRLVQLAAHVWLKTHRRIEQWKEQFISNLCQEFPTADYQNRERCRALFPHVRLAMSQRPESQESLRQWATLLYKGALFASQSGNIADVRAMASKSRKQRVRMLGAESEEALASTAMVAKACNLEGQWDEAEKLLLHVMDTRKVKLGKDHLDMLESMELLAETYLNQGRFKEAEQLVLQVLKARKTKLGEDHLDTLESIELLAGTYLNQGRLKEAEQLFVQVLEARRVKLGEAHPDTLASMGNLASTYRNQGQWDKAEQLGEEVMKTYKTKLGEDHPDTLSSMANLASTCMYQGQWEKAGQLFLQVMETRKTKLGADHPSTLTSMGNLASTYRNQGRWEEAEQLNVQVVETCKTKLGADHPNTLTSMSNLALTFSDQGRWEEAEQLNVQILEARKAKLGEDHPDTLSSLSNLALTYYNQGRWEEAEQLNVQVVETCKIKLGSNHPDTLTSMSNLAATFLTQGRWEEAEQLNVQILEARKAKLGEDHPDTLSSMSNLAVTFSDQGRWEEAEQLFVQILEALKVKLGEDHPDTLSNMSNLASTYRNQGRWEEAEQLEVQIMETSKTKLGADHPDTLMSMANLARTIMSLGQDKAALQLMAESVRLCDRKLGPDHPHTMSSRSTLNKWRGKCDSPSSQSTKAPTEIKEGQNIASSRETSKRVSKSGRHQRRTIFSRLFSRK